MIANRPQPFQVNGWTVSPCSFCTDGYEVSCGDESYPEPTLEAAVRSAQRFTPTSSSLEKQR